MTLENLAPGKMPPKKMNAIIEIPENGHVKYEIDKETGMLKVDRILHAPMAYPANYGYFPGTLGDDVRPKPGGIHRLSGRAIGAGTGRGAGQCPGSGAGRNHSAQRRPADSAAAAAGDRCSGGALPGDFPNRAGAAGCQHDFRHRRHIRGCAFGLSAGKPGLAHLCLQQLCHHPL